MTTAPLIVMVRPVASSEGWRVHVSESGRFAVDEHVDVSHELGAEHVTVRSRQGGAGADAVRRGERWDVEMGAPLTIRAQGGSIELVCFRADDTTPVKKLPPRVLEAIDAVRRQDNPAARTVLMDVLEELGAVAEAAYVKLEQQLQQRPSDLAERLVQFRALGIVVGTTFRYLVGRDVAGCAGLRWTFRCPRKWDEMTATPDERVRACEPCRQLVARAESEEDAKDLARRGVCVSLRLPELEDWEGEVEPEPGDEPPWVGEVAAPEDPEPEG